MLARYLRYRKENDNKNNNSKPYLETKISVGVHYALLTVSVYAIT